MCGGAPLRYSCAAAYATAGMLSNAASSASKRRLVLELAHRRIRIRRPEKLLVLPLLRRLGL
jgi:hypothetical protein